jgi:hypothetical protein
MAESKPTKDPWHIAFDEFVTRDKKMVNDFREEVDTLLVVVRGLDLLFVLGLMTFT